MIRCSYLVKRISWRMAGRGMRFTLHASHFTKEAF